MSNYAGAGVGASSRDLWWEEEERFREQQRRAAEQRAAEQSWKQQERSSSISEKPHQYFVQEAESAKLKLLGEKESSQVSPLEDYYKMANRYGGEDKLAQRVQAVKTAWKTYMSPYDGKGAIWELARSPYTIKQIETMLSTAHGPMFNSGMVPASKIRELDLDPNDDADTKQANLFYGANGWVHAPAVIGLHGGWAQKVWNGLKSFWEWGQKPITGEGGMAAEFGRWATTSASESSINPMHLLNINRETLRGPKDINELGQWVNPLDESNRKAIGIGLAVPAVVAGGGLVSAGLGAAAGGGAAATLGGMAGALAGSGLVMAGAGEAIGQMSPVADAATQEAIDARFRAVNNQPIDRIPLYEWSYDKDEYGNVTPYLTTASQRIDASMDYIEYLGSNVDPTLEGTELLIEMQKSIQTDFMDESGNVLVWGKAKDKEANGILDDEWKQYFRDALEDVERAKIEEARSLMDLGYVPAWAPLDNLAHSVWQRGKEKMAADTVWQQERKEHNVLINTWWDHTGIPLGPAGLDKFFNKLFANGVLQGIYKTPIEAAKVAGEMYNASLSSFGVWARLQGDSEYQQWKRDVLILGAKELGGIPNMEQIETAYQEGRFENAGDLLKKINQREAQVIEQRFSPALFLDMQHLFGGDPEKIEEWGRNNPDAVHAAQLLFDVGMGLMVPLKIKGRPVPRTFEAFMSDARAGARSMSVANDIRKGNTIDAVKQMGGKDAAGIVTEFSRTWKGNPLSATLNKVIANVQAVAAKKGWRQAVLESTELRGAAADQLAYDLMRAEQKAFAKNQPTGRGYAVVSETNALKAAEKATATVIRQAQKSNHNLLDFDRFVYEESARRWSTADGQPADIYPYLQKPELKTPSLIGRDTSIFLRSIENPTLRRTLTHLSAKFRRAPLDQIEFGAASGPEVIETIARIVSDDEVWARGMAEKWIRTNSRRGKQAIADTIADVANKRFKLDKAFKPESEQGMFSAIVPHPETGELIAKGKSIPDTSYQSYKAMLGKARDTMIAPYRVEDIPWLEKVAHTVIDNPYRFIARTAKRPARVMRQWAVAMGPQLFVKHGLTDTGRTIIEDGPGAVLFSKKTNASYDAIMHELSSETFAEVMAQHVKNELSEQHYNVGPREKWTAGHIYDAKGKPVNMAEGVDALRRVTQGEAFASYVNGGETGLRLWLDSKKGRRFLAESGNITRVKEQLGGAGEAPKGRALVQTTIDDFVQTYMKGYWEALQMNAPNIYAGLEGIVKAGRNPLAPEIKGIVEQVNRNGVQENPYLSMENGEGWGKFPHLEFFERAPGKLTAMWMTSNKWNRRILFRDTFVKTYKELREQGAEADAAARVASTVADLNTARVHFDLSHAMLVEQQNRWFAWFATKHRLYGTYLMKMAAERPAIAAAALEVAHWLEDNNERMGGNEYDKYTIKVNIGPMSARFPVAPIFWLSDYPLESNMGRGVVWGGAQLLNLMGRETHSGPGTFGWQATPIDDEIKTIALYAPLMTRYFSGSELTDEEVESWLDYVKSVPVGGQDAYEQACYNIGMARALAKAQGLDVTVGQATGRAMLSNILYEVQQAIRLPVKVDIAGGVKSDLEKRFDEYIKLSPEDRAEYGRQHPEVLMMIGIRGLDPVTKTRIDKGWEDLNRLKMERATELWEAYKLNPDFDPTPILKRYRDKINQIFDPDWRDPETGEASELSNPEFAGYFNGLSGDQSKIEDVLGGIWPFMSPATIRKATQAGYVPTEEQYDIYRQQLQDNFESQLADMGGLSTQDPLYSYYHNLLVDEPLAKFAKDDPTRWHTWEDLTVAREIAQGPGGDEGSQAYLLELENRHKLEMFKRGAQGNYKDGVKYPIFMTMTNSERIKSGWVGTEESRSKWGMYAGLLATTKRYMAERDISTQSNQGKAMLAALEQEAIKWAENDEQFAKEWDFANKPLYERMKYLGVGSEDTERGRGWSEFLALVTDYHDELAAVNNGKGVGPTSKTAGPISRKWLREVVKLAKRNEDWKRSFMSSFTLGNFGFYDKLGDGSDLGLWKVVDDEDEGVGY